MISFKHIYSKITRNPSSSPGRAGVWSILMLSLLLFGCTDSEKDSPVPDAPQETATLTLHIPAVSFNTRYSTRAEGDKVSDPLDRNSGEGALQSLYFIVFQKDEEDGGKYKMKEIKNLFNASYFFEVAEEKDYEFAMDAGSYRFYLLANIENYVRAGLDASVLENEFNFEEYIDTEEEIRELVLTFSKIAEQSTSTGISANALPMVCMAEDFMYWTSSTGYQTFEDGIYSITDDQIKSGGAPTIYAFLDILCAKVRYTVLFDRTSGGFSSSFPHDEVNFPTAPTLTNLCMTSKMYVPKEESTEEGQSDEVEVMASTPAEGFFNVTAANWNRVYYPTDTQIYSVGWPEYLNIENQDADANSPADLSPMTAESSWTNSSQRAWQGKVYVPENLDENNKANLHLTATGLGVNPAGYDITFDKLERGHFYDVVAKMTNSEAMSISCAVHVNAWAYSSVDVEW